jgi:hypothetical protein
MGMATAGNTVTNRAAISINSAEADPYIFAGVNDYRKLHTFGIVPHL